MKQAFLLLVFMLCCGISYAQESVNDGSQTNLSPYTHYFGLGAGIMSGVGLSYRYWPKPWGLQVNCIPVVNQNTIYTSIGLLGLYLINDAQWSRFFLYFGGSYTYNQYKDNSRIVYKQNFAYLGGGIGMELVLFDHFGLDLMGGLDMDYTDDNGIGSGLTVDGGIYYRL